MAGQSKLNLSPNQRESLSNLRRNKYYRMRFLGLDAQGRPVISALVGNPTERLTWAIQRNGDPTDPTEPIEKLDLEAIFGKPPGRVL